MGYAIEIQNLKKSFQQFQLGELDFTLPKGTIMGLVGQNGAGKTTLIKLLLNQLKLDSGTIQILGENAIQNEKNVKERIGVVFDQCHFHDILTAKEISSILKKIYQRWDSQLFESHLERFQVPFQKKIKFLSRGMQMKLSIAVALSHDAELLILDEATSGLDPIVRNEILDILLDYIQDENRTVLFSTHITSDLEKIADYVTFLDHGMIQFSESKDALLEDYGLLLCKKEELSEIDKKDIVGHRSNLFGHEILVKNKSDMKKKHPSMQMNSVSIEDIMLFYIKGDQSI